MKTEVLISVLIGMGLLVSGCGTTTEIVRMSDKVLEARALDNDFPIIEGAPDRPFREIAIIEIKKRGWIPFTPPASYELHPRLKMKAAKLGAEALILVEYEQSRWRATTTAQATAVVFTDGSD